MPPSAKKGSVGEPPVQDVADPLVGTKMRVWWAPTTNKNRTGFAGAYWPAMVLAKKGEGKYMVEYDNGDREVVMTEDLAPDDPPLDFGAEPMPLQPGEFCEVSNNSPTDPCAWVAVVSKRLPNDHYLVHYPFHDSPAENIAPELIRRARVLDMDGWCLLKPHQKWHDGEVLSPHELDTIKEEELGKYVTLKPKGEAGKAGPKEATSSRNGAGSNGGLNQTGGGVGSKRTAGDAQLKDGKPNVQRGRA